MHANTFGKLNAMRCDCEYVCVCVYDLSLFRQCNKYGCCLGMKNWKGQTHQYTQTVVKVRSYMAMSSRALPDRFFFPLVFSFVLWIWHMRTMTIRLHTTTLHAHSFTHSLTRSFTRAFVCSLVCLVRCIYLLYWTEWFQAIHLRTNDILAKNRDCSFLFVCLFVSVAFCIRLFRSISLSIHTHTDMLYVFIRRWHIWNIRMLGSCVRFFLHLCFFSLTPYLF